MFATEAKSWILKLVAIRVKLIRNEKSLKPFYRMTENCVFLQDHLEYFTWTDRTMAGFFLRNAVKIHEIIPGHEHAQHFKLYDEYNAFTERARRIEQSAKQKAPPQRTLF